MIATRQPAFASTSPAVAPPGPPPSTKASYWLDASAMAQCCETVAEHSCRPFLDLPFLPAGPKLRKLRSREPGAHAQHGVVSGHGVASEHPQAAGGKQRPPCPSRLRGDEQPGHR